MPIKRKTFTLCQLAKRVIQFVFQRIGHHHVAHRAARRTQQVVMVAREVFGQFVPRLIPCRHHL
jgi:hypothetical protein